MLMKWILFDISKKNQLLNKYSFFSLISFILQAWAYLEGFRDGKAFMKEAKRITAKKPMLLIKSNRSAAGAKASASHSASLAANDAVCDQLLKNVRFAGISL